MVRHVMGALIMTSIKQTEKSLQISWVSNLEPLDHEMSAQTFNKALTLFLKRNLHEIASANAQADSARVFSPHLSFMPAALNSGLFRAFSISACGKVNDKYFG